MDTLRRVSATFGLATILLFSHTTLAQTISSGGTASTDPKDESTDTTVECVSLEDGDCESTCDTEDCIDERPNHECVEHEEDCSDSWLSVSTSPCNNTTQSCEEEEEEETPTRFTSIPYKYKHVMSLSDVKKAKGTLLDRADEEVARVGGYLADINHDNIFGFRLSDVISEKEVLLLLRLMRSYIRKHGLEIELVLYRESVKTMVAEVLGELVQTYPYKRRRCGTASGVGEKFRWRLGERIKVEKGLVWNRHMSPMVEASIDGIAEDIEAQFRTLLEKVRLEEHTTIKVTIKSCGTAPEGAGSSLLP